MVDGVAMQAYLSDPPAAAASLGIDWPKPTVVPEDLPPRLVAPPARLLTTSARQLSIPARLGGSTPAAAAAAVPPRGRVSARAAGRAAAATAAETPNGMAPRAGALDIPKAPLTARDTAREKSATAAAEKHSTPSTPRANPTGNPRSKAAAAAAATVPEATGKDSSAKEGESGELVFALPRLRFCVSHDFLLIWGNM